MGDDSDDVCFRLAAAEDVASLLEVMQQEGDARLNAADLIRDGFGEKCCFKLLLAELKSPSPSTVSTSSACDASSVEKIIGYVLYFYTYSTWEGRVMFIEDLFVRNDYQNKGYGTALVKEVAKVAVDRDCCRIIVLVQEDNSRARKLLDRLGGQTLHSWLTVWLYRPDLQRLVEQPMATVSDRSPQVIYRPARESDAPNLLRLVHLMATDMKAPPNGVKIGEKEILRDGFGEECFFKVLLVELASPSSNLSLSSHTSETNENLIGYAFYYFTYSSQQGRIIYLEDVFIKAEFRNKGYGTTLIKEVAKIGHAEGCSRMMWQVLDWNTKAIRLYKRVGGTIINRCVEQGNLIQWNLSAKQAFLSSTERKDKMGEDVCFRHASKGDVSSLFELMQLYGSQQEGEARLNAADLIRDGFGEKKCCFKVLLAELKSLPPSASSSSVTVEKIIGYILYFYTYSTLEGRVMFIEELFVRDDYQNKGYGTALVKEVAKVGVDRDCCHIVVLVQEDNSRARKLLDRLGGQTLHDWLTVWLYKPDLQRFVDQPMATVSDSSPQVIYRPVRESDAPSLLKLVQLMTADIMKLPPNAVKIGEKEILRDGFGEECFFKALLVELASPSSDLSPSSDSLELNENLIGCTFYYFTYSSQQGRMIHLEDVFVKAEFRNKGYGTTMIKEVAKIGHTEGCSRMTWQVLDWNTKAIRLYKRVGGTIMSGLLTVKIPGSNFHKLAS